MAVPDEQLKQYATERQWEIYTTACELGNQGAADRLGINVRNVHAAIKRLQDAAALAGVIPARVKPESEKLDVVQEHLLKRQNNELKKQISELVNQKVETEDFQRIVLEIFNQRPQPPKWISEKPKAKRDEAIATAFLSDCHFDEVVNSAEINYVNEYNRQIAEQRLEAFFRNTLKLSFQYNGGIDVKGLILPFGGDMVSGDIHEELKVTNDAPIIETVLHWSERLIAGINLLLTKFDKIHIPAVTGNHGRMSRKPQAKQRAGTNFDYLIYKLVERHFQYTKEVTFDIPVESDARWSVYNTRYHMTHGDQFRGGNGIAGIYSPIMRGDHRKRTREQSVNSPYDVLIMGHWHSLKDMGKIVINGSLKGYDEYAAACNFEFEEPKQAFWLTDPKWGKLGVDPVFVIDSKRKAA